MLVHVLRFELKYHFSQIVFRVALLIFFLLGVVCVQGGFGADVYKNSPYVIADITGLLSLCGIFSATLLCANTVLRDRVYRLDAIVFSTSISKQPYFVTRFSGLLIAVFLTIAVTSLGMMAGAFALPSSSLGPFQPLAYVYALLVIGFPNILLCCVIIFSAALLTGSIRAVYGAGVLLYVLYWAGSILGNSPLLATSDPTAVPGTLSLLADPFGLSVFFMQTKQWTAQQKNSLLIPLEGVFLANRILWLGIASVILYGTFRAFRFRLQLTDSGGRSASMRRVNRIMPVIPYNAVMTASNGYRYSWHAFVSQLKLETISLFKHIPFMVLMILWIFMYAVELKDTLFGGIYSIRAYPDTSRIVQEFVTIRPVMVLIIFYAAELIWRERSANIHSLVYSTPVRNIVHWAAKCCCLVILIAVVITANIGIGIGLQLANGYDKLSLPEYLSLYYYSGFPLLLFAVLAMFIATVTPNKYVGLLAGALIAAVLIFSRRLGIEHFMLRFAAVPEMEHSAMNGFGHYAQAFNWYMLYWSGFAIIIGFMTILFWKDSRQHRLMKKTKLALAQLGRAGKLAGLAGMLVWIFAGYKIYYQTNVLGKYKSSYAGKEWQAAYEKKYKPMAIAVQPVIRRVKTEIDIYPDQQRYRVKGSYWLKNESPDQIFKIWIGIDPEVTKAAIAVPGNNRVRHDDIFDQYFIELEQPLLPGKELTVSFSLDLLRSGFVPFNNENAVVKNGSYIELEKYLPCLGYNDRYELEGRSSRIEHGLSERSAMLPADTIYHYIDYETTVSTAKGQKVVTVGRLQQVWEKDGRSFFHYKTESPVPMMLALSSAAYEQKSQLYKGVQLKLYYHPGHEANLDAMLKGMKDALDYGSENFSAYPFTTLTLAEIPQYRGAATAYPGVLFSTERINFTSDYRDTSRVNQAYAITVHETAHQWWAVKLQPAALPGNKVLTESLAKYTENAVLAKHSGKMHLRSYLQDDNQLYTVYRSMTENEQAMDTVVAQPFVYYQKGGLTLFAIRQSLGEQKFTRALRQLLSKHACPGVKAGVRDLYNLLLEQSTPAQAGLVTDVFKRIIAWRITLDSVTVHPTASGQFEVVCRVSAGKMEGPYHSAKKTGISDSLVVAVFEEKKDRLSRSTAPRFSGNYLINRDHSELRFVVNFKPGSVCVDPFMYMIGDDPEDNIRDVVY